MCTYVAVLGKGSAHGAADSANGRRHFFFSAVTEEKSTVRLRPGRPSQRLVVAPVWP